jgi:hypothetical protein
LESKEDLFNKCGELQTDLKERQFRIDYLEKVGAEKD